MGARGPKPGTRPSGRQKGTPNKRTLHLEARIKDAVRALKGKKGFLPVPKDYDPLVELATLGFKKGVSDDLRAKCHKEVAEYLHAKRKAIEVTGEDGGPIETENKTTYDLSKLGKNELKTLERIAERIASASE